MPRVNAHGLSPLARGELGARHQRHAPATDLDFADEEVVTTALFAVAMEQNRQIKAIHRHRLRLAGRVPSAAQPRRLCAAPEPAYGLRSGAVVNSAQGLTSLASQRLETLAVAARRDPGQAFEQSAKRGRVLVTGLARDQVNRIGGRFEQVLGFLDA